MRALLRAAILLSLAATAEAGLPTLNYGCPGNIELHTDEGGPAYINGNQAKLHNINDSTYEVTGGGVTVSIGLNPDGSASVMYTSDAKKGALKTEQRGWVKGRDHCWKSDDMRRCVASEYRSRIAELKDR